MGTDGISKLISVTQMKTNNANDQALAGAQQQRPLINQQKSLHAVQRKFTELTRTEQQTALHALQLKLAAFRKTLTSAEAALLDQWLEWAAQHR